MDANKCRFGKGANPWMKLGIMRVAFSKGGFIECLAGFAQESTFVNDVFVLWQNVLPAVLE